MANIFTRSKQAAPDVNASGDGVIGLALTKNVSPAGGFGVWRGPIGDIGVDADSNTVVVSNFADGSVSVIQPDAPSVEGVPVGGEPFAVAAANDRAFVSTASASYDAVAVIDTVTKTVIATYPLAFSVTALAASPDGKKVFAARAGHRHVDIAMIDTTAERVGTIDVAKGSAVSIDALRVDKSGKRLYVATSGPRGGRLVQINTETARVEASVSIGSPIRDLAVGSGGTAYVLTTDRTRGGVIEAVDLSKGRIAETFEMGGAPTQMAISPDGSRLYIVDFDHVAVLCVLTNEVVDTITVAAAVVRRAERRRFAAVRRRLRRRGHRPCRRADRAAAVLTCRG